VHTDLQHCVCLETSLQATELRPDSKEAWLGRGAIAQDAGELETAAGHLSRALALDPLCWRVGINVGNLAARQGDLKTAMRAFRHVIRTNPFVPQAFYSRGFLQLLQGQLTLSCASFQQAWALKSDLHTIPEFLVALDGLQSLRSAMAAAGAGQSCPVPQLLHAGAGDTEIVSLWEDSYMAGQGRAECEQVAMNIVTVFPSLGHASAAGAQQDGRNAMDIAREFVGRMHALYGPDCAGLVTIHIIFPAESLEAKHLAEAGLWDLVKLHKLPSSSLLSRSQREGKAAEAIQWVGGEAMAVIRELQTRGNLPRELVAIDMQVVVSQTGRAAFEVGGRLLASYHVYPYTRGWLLEIHVYPWYLVVACVETRYTCDCCISYPRLAMLLRWAIGCENGVE
jgi:hypothetical protein